MERVIQNSFFEKGLAISERLEKRKNDLKHFCLKDKLRDASFGEHSFAGEVLSKNGSILSFVGQGSEEAVLKRISFWGNLPEFDLVLFDVFMELSLGKDFKEISRITLREVESYLRDVNHEPSFSGLEFEESFFDSLKEGLMEQLLLSSLIQHEYGANIDFETLPLIKKLGLLQKIIYDRVSPCLENWGIGIELIYFKEDRLICSLKGASLDQVLIKKSLGSFVQKTLAENLVSRKLNVFLEFFYK